MCFCTACNRVLHSLKSLHLQDSCYSYHLIFYGIEKARGDWKSMQSSFRPVFPISYFESDTLWTLKPVFTSRWETQIASFPSLSQKNCFKIISEYNTLSHLLYISMHIHTCLFLREANDRNYNSTRKGKTSKHPSQFLVHIFLENKNLQFCEWSCGHGKSNS